MKKMAVACVAMCAACMAQAVTLSWKTGAADSIYEGKAIPSEGTVSSAKSASFSLLVTAKATAFSSGYGEIARVSLWNSGWVFAGMYGPGNGLNGHVGVEKKGSGGEAWGTSQNLPSATVGERYLLSFTFARAEDDLTVKGYVNGTEIFSVSTSRSAEQIRVQTFQDDAFWTIEETAAYEGLLSPDEIAWMAENGTAVLPEPTVLALLALGVSGLALRRRVACV